MLSNNLYLNKWSYYGYMFICFSFRIFESKNLKVHVKSDSVLGI